LTPPPFSPFFPPSRGECRSSTGGFHRPFTPLLVLWFVVAEFLSSFSFSPVQPVRRNSPIRAFLFFSFFLGQNFGPFSYSFRKCMLNEGLVVLRLSSLCVFLPPPARRRPQRIPPPLPFFSPFPPPTNGGKGSGRAPPLPPPPTQVSPFREKTTTSFSPPLLEQQRRPTTDSAFSPPSNVNKPFPFSPLFFFLVIIGKGPLRVFLFLSFSPRPPKNRPLGLFLPFPLPLLLPFRRYRIGAPR